MTMHRARVTGIRLSESSRALELQVLGAEFPGQPTKSDTGWAQAFGDWCLYAPPALPSTSPDGSVGAAAEAFFTDDGDEIVCLGQRDVRWSKYAQDLKPGEVALLNAFQVRMVLGQKATSIAAYGGFLSFDKASSTVSLVGIPASPGGGAPSFSIGTSSAGMTSETGAATVTVSGASARIAGSDVAIDGGSVSLGTGAVDRVVRMSDLTAAFNALALILASHTHPVPALGTSGVPAASFAVPITASTRVKCA